MEEPKAEVIIADMECVCVGKGVAK